MNVKRNVSGATFLMAALLLMGVETARAGGEAVIAAATGGGAISADTAGTTWTSLTGPVITETYARDIGAFSLGTIVLTVPEGFKFNTVDPVRVLLYAEGHKTINGEPNYAVLIPQVTATAITLEITATSRGGIAWPDTLEYQNIQVCPIAGYPLASGHITESGTCELRNPLLISGTWGFLRVVGGELAGYRIAGPTQLTAGTEAMITVQKVDQYGNPLADNTPALLTFSGLGTIGTYAPTISGSSSAFGGGIEVAFDSNGTATLPLVAYQAETAILNVSDGSVSSADINGGLPLVVSPGPASNLVLTSSAASIVYGGFFSVVVQVQDAYGNHTAPGSDLGADISLAVTSGPGSLLNGAAQPIATPDGTFVLDGLQISAAGPNQILTVTAGGLSPASVTISVFRAPIVPAVTVAGKTYDGTTAATITSRSLDGAFPGDDVNLGASGTANFDTKHVGAAKTVTVADLALTGAAANNYILSTTTLGLTADITPRHVTVFPAHDAKTYDGTSDSTATPTLSGDGLAAGDLPDFSQVYDNRMTGKGKLLIPRGVVKDGNGGKNYVVTLIEGTNGAIDPLPITVQPVADIKTYDATTTSTGTPALVSGYLVEGDRPNFVQAFADKNSGASRTLTATGVVNDGNDGKNYLVTFVSASTGTILPRPLHVTATGVDKVYDGTTAAAISLNDDRLAGDLLNLTYTSAAFEGVGAGVAKTIVVTGIQADGTDAANYVPNTSALATANILPAGSVTRLAASPNPVFQGSSVTLTATVSPVTPSGLVPGGTVQFLSDGNPVGGPVTLVDGNAAVSTADLAYGTHSITATYSGSNDFLDSSATLSLVVDIETPQVLSIVNNGDGTATITAKGQPGMLYVVQATANLAPPIQWVNVATNAAGLTDGIWQYVDDMTQYPQRFFRVAKP